MADAEEPVADAVPAADAPADEPPAASAEPAAEPAGDTVAPAVGAPTTTTEPPPPMASEEPVVPGTSAPVLDDSAVSALYARFKGDEGVPLSALGELVTAAGFSVENLDTIVSTVLTPGATAASESDVKSVLQFVKESQAGGGGKSPKPRAPGTQSATWGHGAARSRSYLENGYVTDDVAVLSFLTALELHRKKCEKEGKYMEARQAAKRLRELKEQEVGKRRAEMGDRHAGERSQAERAYALETDLQMRSWESKLDEYERAAADKLARLHEVHLARLGAFRDGVEATRPTVAHKSRELLEQRRVEESLARLGKYVEAAGVKAATDKREEAELAATLATYENEVYLKEQQLLSKQLQEAEALQQRIARGRDELKKTWALDAERRLQRYKNVMAELETLHRLEAVQLEHFLAQQVLAGKQAPAVAVVTERPLAPVTKAPAKRTPSPTKRIVPKKVVSVLTPKTAPIKA